MISSLDHDGFHVFAPDPGVAAWVDAAGQVAAQVLTQDRTPRRYGGTWFVGVDALPNAPDGSVQGVPLGGVWRDHVTLPKAWHRAQLSVVFSGYPGRDPDENDAAFTYRWKRAGAHVDGLLPVGPKRRRFLREPHGFILGVPLNDVDQSPLVVWRGSHRIMGRAFEAALADAPHPTQVDVTAAYHAARREVFAACERIAVVARPGAVVLLHRHLLHGVAPWADPAVTTPRMVAYFRPIISPQDWVHGPAAAR